MKVSLTAFVLLACVDSIFAVKNVLLPRDASPETYAAVALVAEGVPLERAFSDSPTNSYAPGKVDCPANRPTIREAIGLSQNETAWLQLRRNNTIEPMTEFLTRMNIPNFDAAAYMSKVSGNAKTLPNIGIAVSGGGYRALMNGAGFVAAADSRINNATSTGHIGGLLQSATYLAGLSGGGWLVGSLYSNNFSTVVDLRDGSKGSSAWQFSRSIFKGPRSSGISILNSAEYFKDIYNEVQDKNNAGFNTTITDYWGRALSYQLVNATDGGPAYTFSSISLQQNFIAGDVPFPILVADSRAPDETIVSLNSTVYEFNPFELGSWDPTTFVFAPTRYLGSNFFAGSVLQNGSCVAGFDQVGYVMGTSSTLFNEFLLSINTTSLPSLIEDALTGILKDIGRANDDIAFYRPNPFAGFNPSISEIAETDALTLVDGGEDGQNIPLYPLLQPIRGVDVIFAIDSSADTTYLWPNGTSLVATYQRSTNNTVQNGTIFPSIPDQSTFVNLGLNTHPTFFGCNITNLTSPGNTNTEHKSTVPLIVYVPNSPYVAFSNVSTFDPDYSDAQRNAIIENGYLVSTLGNGTVDSQWPVCVACAVLSRSFSKTNTAVPDACTACFTKYCWTGELNSTTPSTYEPTPILGAIKVSGAVVSRRDRGVGSVFAVAALIVAVLM